MVKLGRIRIESLGVRIIDVVRTAARRRETENTCTCEGEIICYACEDARVAWDVGGACAAGHMPREGVEGIRFACAVTGLDPDSITITLDPWYPRDRRQVQVRA